MGKRFWELLTKGCIIQPMRAEPGAEGKFQYSGKAGVLKKNWCRSKMKKYLMAL
jgi:hypothetical protein